MELVRKVTPNSMLKVTLESGSCFIQIKDENGYLIREYELGIKSSDNQLLQEIGVTNKDMSNTIRKIL